MIALTTGRPGHGMDRELRSGADGARSAREGRAASGPRAVTRGERSPKRDQAKVDWLGATFPAPSLTVDGLVQMVAALMGRPVFGVETGRGLLGFETRVALHAYVGAVTAECGSIAYGGEAQRGRWLFQLTGKGCGLVADWDGLTELLEGLGAKLTRVDLAVDFLEGEHTVEEACVMHRQGEFATGKGRPPSSSVDGDWLDGVHGRTVNIGRTGNGKTLCVYEKGKQLGDLASPWVRFEVRLGNRDREIPFETLTAPTRFFCGAYPALERMIGEAAESIPTSRVKARTTLSHLLFHLRRCYGKAIDAATRIACASEAELIEEMRVIGLPRRLDPAGVDAGFHWSQVRDSLRRFQR